MAERVMGLAVLFALLAITARLLQLGFALVLLWLAATAALAVLATLVAERLRRTPR